MLYSNKNRKFLKILEVLASSKNQVGESRFQDNFLEHFLEDIKIYMKQ